MGNEEGLGELLDGGIGSLQTRRYNLMWRFPSARHHVEFMRGYYGPLHKDFETLDEEGQNALEEDLISLVGQYNRSNDGTAVWPADFTLRWSRPGVEISKSALQSSKSCQADPLKC